MKSYKVSNSGSISTPSSSSQSVNSTMKRGGGSSINVARFQNELKQLTKDQQAEVKQILSNYHQTRNIYYLVQSLKNHLIPSEQLVLFPLLRHVIPKSDRPGFDQFTCDETLVRRESQRSSCYQQRTNDSGIGSNSAGPSSVDISRSGSRKLSSKPSRSSSMSELSRKNDAPRSPKRFSSGTFGSAVRRKIQAALSRRSSSSSREMKSTFRRRHNSDGHLSEPENSNEMNNNQINTSRHRKQTLSNCMQVFLSRQTSGEDMGFTIGGGSEVGKAVFVSEVHSESPAEKAGLTPGDVIKQINDVPIHKGISHATAAMMLKSCDNLTLYVLPSAGKKPMAEEKGFAWTDTRGRPASPPDGLASDFNHHSLVLDNSKSNMKLLSSGERKMTLTVQPGQNLGLMIRGGSEYGLGIYVTGVDENSAAENAGLKAGDELLEVNNVRLNGASHAEAVNLIRSNQMLFITVRHVGRIPQALHTHANHQQRLLDDRVSLHSSVAKKRLPVKPGPEQSNGVKNAFQRRVMSSKQLILPNMHVKSLPSKGVANISTTMSTLEDALLASDLWLTLGDNERRSVRYYVKEYASGHVTPDALVLSLAELLNDHEKFSLMSAVRQCIHERDLDRFDVLVLRREIEVLKSRHQSSLSGNESSTTAGSQANDRSNDRDPITPPRDHSTPNNLHKTRKDEISATTKLSPVRPSVKPPPPPTPPLKTPPAKPKRSRSRASVSSVESNSQASSSACEAQQNLDGGSTKPDERSPSPFSLALQKQKTSNSGRIKMGPKTPTHHSVPSREFFSPFTEPDDNKETGVVQKKSIIEPVKKPSLKYKRDCSKRPPLAREYLHDEEFSSEVSSLQDVDFPAPPSLLTTTSSRETSFSSGAVFSNSLAIRSSFGSTVKSMASSSPASSRYPVKADVHQPPEQFTDPPEVAPKSFRMTSFSRKQHAYDFDNEANSTDEDERTKYPFLADNVETQKVVIFRVAGTLGLTLEGGAGTQQPLPKVLKIQSGSCAHMCGRLRRGHIIHSVNGRPLLGLNHDEAIRAVASAFKQRNRDSMEMNVSGPYD